MTDNEIIKAMQCVIGNSVSCSECEYQKALLFPICRRMCAENALDLINRQKAEIARLKRKNTILSKNADTAFQDGLNENRDLFKKEVEPEIRNEAIKEFVGKLTDKISVYSNHVDVDGIVILNRIYRMIEDIEKEMTEV